MRRRFESGRRGWRYFTLGEIIGLHESFASLKYETFGTLGCFGQSERQRSWLGALDRALIDRLIPRGSRYIVAGIARKAAR